MSEWDVLDLAGDPAPGDPARTRELAGRLHRQAQLTERNTGLLREVAANDGALRMEGDYAPKFRQVLGELPGELAKLERADRACGDALSTFASSLEEAKARAGAALRQGRDADDRHRGALNEIRAVLPANREPALGAGRRLDETALAAATVDLDPGLQAQVQAAVRRARIAEDDRARARRLAEEAARLRGDAETRCVQGIEGALEGIKNKSFFEKSWDFFSTPFRSWDDFVNLARNVAMVAGVVALFLSGPIGLAFLAIALVAGAAVFADTLSKFARGEAELADAGLEALGLIPGGRGAISIAKLGRSALGLARGVARGEGTIGRCPAGAQRRDRISAGARRHQEPARRGAEESPPIRPGLQASHCRG